MPDTSLHFVKTVQGLGRFELFRLRIPEDIALLHRWMTLPYAHFWGLQGASADEVEAEYRTLATRSDIFLGYRNSEPAFLLERYDPRLEPVGRHYAVADGDCGMHILLSPPDRPVAGFSWAVFSLVMEFLFSDEQVCRVVVEPDMHNDRIHRLNRRAGFEYDRFIELPGKTAHLAFCTREQYRRALRLSQPNMQTQRTYDSMTTPLSTAPQQAVAHLEPALWTRVNRLHIRKSIAELSHERLIAPTLESTQGDWGHYRLTTDTAAIEYRFRARLLALDHWAIDTASIEKRVDGTSTELDALAFIIEHRERLGIADDVLPTYLEEIASTLYGSAWKHLRPGLRSEALVDADFQTLEGAMMEGHPCFLANNGRIGFDTLDYRAYTPEAAAPIRLIWVAAHRSKTVFASLRALPYRTLLEEELGADTLSTFDRQLETLGLDPADYVLMPVHPWQWYNKLASVFAADIARRDLVCLGEAEDHYQAQQSIRTFFNRSQPHKRYVKTALSILNMGFMRGLSPYYMSTTPAINDWIHALVEQDPWLAAKGFSILREVAAVGYRNAHFEAAIAGDSPYKKMLSALWRESPLPQLGNDQRLMTMAALLHIDADGKAFLAALINRAGVNAETWLQRYLDAYLSPLLHCFYAHDLVFMPHGENLILVLENNVPVRAIMKDIAEESAIMNTEVVLSEKVQRLSVEVPEQLKVLSIFTDVFDCFFRFLGQVLVEQCDVPQEAFWRLVADSIIDYQQAHPELADKFDRYDLFADEFTLSCLNRLQLGNNRQMIDLADPARNLKFAGTLRNPIAQFRPAQPGAPVRAANG